MAPQNLLKCLTAGNLATAALECRLADEEWLTFLLRIL